MLTYKEAKTALTDIITRAEEIVTGGHPTQSGPARDIAAIAGSVLLLLSGSALPVAKPATPRPAKKTAPVTPVKAS